MADSPAFGALGTALRRAEPHGLNVDRAVPALAQGITQGAVDAAAVLHRRVERWREASLEAGSGQRPDLICGLLPAAKRVEDPEFAQALAERRQLIEHRANDLVDRARTAEAPWLQALGADTDEVAGRSRRGQAASTISAYRELNGIADPTRPLGPEPPEGTQQRTEYDLAVRAAGPVYSREARPVTPRLAAEAEAFSRTPVGR